ncbi:hypothetical protein [Variovorax ginsengisoli]|uniref:HEPN AbiU2-like domain-containing protein n=1 Tax=Variovorax ginsengisoli TaxID=363844 RepID=A0ABT8SDC0_9BURK|nr:hypothetical protein [Variovorax ginsengisoli]MDN8617248.1 hypothetical protein [Variovorax ginsengisoli]MDO1536418.1 hypothetical protein [Variovorax ginsengisoli]
MDDDIREALKGLNQDVGRALKARDPWPFNQDRACRLSRLIRAEWDAHRLTALQTFTVASIKLTDQYGARAMSTDFDVKLALLRINGARNAIAPLTASNLQAFFNLSLTIAESAAKLLGYGLVIDAFEYKGALDAIKETLKAGDNKFATLDESLFLAEAAMQRMLLMSLLAELWTVETRFNGPPSFANFDPVTAAELKERVVVRLRTYP